jgi:hypothetical protein
MPFKQAGATHHPATHYQQTTTEGTTMKYRVILVAEDGEYTLTDSLSYNACVRYCRDNEGNYGEGQHLEIREAGHV